MSLASRILKLEPRPLPIIAPHVVTVEHGESADDARVRFMAKYGSKLRSRHGLIVVPARIEAEHEAAFAGAFEAQQIQLVARAKSPPKPKDESNG